MAWLVALVFAALFACAALLPPLVSALHLALIVRRRRERGTAVRPVNVVVPCSGADQHLEGNLRAIATQDHPRFGVSVVTDTEEDSARGVIEAVGRELDHVRHVVAGPAPGGAQKSHAVAMGVRADRGSEILVVCDSGLRPNGTWLREMVLPLESGEAEVSSSHHWVHPERPGLAPFLFSALSGYLTMLMGLPRMGWLWGGCFAMPRELFERLRVPELWARTVADDTTLQRELARAGIRPVFVPSAVSPAAEAPVTVRGLVRWFARQAHGGRLYLTPAWAIGMVSVNVATLATVCSAGVLVGAAFAPGLRGFVHAAAVVLGSLMLQSVLVKLPHLSKRDVPLWFWPLAPLIGYPLLVASLWISAFMRRVRWGRVVYDVDRRGIVSKQRREET